MRRNLRIILSHKDLMSAGCGGGISTLYFYLAQELSKLGHQVTAIGGRVKSLRAENFDYRYVPFTNYLDFRRAIYNLVLKEINIYFLV